MDLNTLNIPKLSEEKIKEIERLYASWGDLREKFTFVDPNTIDDTSSFPASYVTEMAAYIDAIKPLPITSHRKLIGPVIIFCKKIVVKLFAPILRLCLGRQLYLNNYVWSLALAVVILESRVKELEGKKKNG